MTAVLAGDPALVVECGSLAKNHSSWRLASRRGRARRLAFCSLVAHSARWRGESQPRAHETAAENTIPPVNCLPVLAAGADRLAVEVALQVICQLGGAGVPVA